MEILNQISDGQIIVKIHKGMIAFSRDERRELWERRKSWKHSLSKELNRALEEELEKSLSHF